MANNTNTAVKSAVAPKTVTIAVPTVTLVVNPPNSNFSAKAVINRAAVPDLIRSITPGQFFTMSYDRALPKCTNGACNKTNKNWLTTKPSVCPVCGSPVSYHKETTCQRCVKNPKNTAYTPNGRGMTWQEALAKGIIKYYDMNAVNRKTGIKEPAYRECLIANVYTIVANSVEYTVI